MSRSPNNTLDTSRWGSHSVNPRPIRSIAALLRGVWLGIVSLDGANTRYIKAFAVRRTSTVPRAGGSALLPPPDRSCSRSKRAPRTPQRITAVVWFLRAATALGSPSSSGLGKIYGEANPQGFDLRLKEFWERRRKKRCQKRSNDVEDCRTKLRTSWKSRGG